MKKTIQLLMVVFLLAAASLAAQDAPVQGGEKPRLAIVPFSGGEGDDGENIAELFSGSRDLAQVFRIYPRTSITFGIDEERNVQKYVVSNDEYRNQLLALGINYVVAGDITRLGQQSLLVISIIDIEKLVQIAGDIQIFEKPREIEGKLPDMTRNIIDGMKTEWTNKPKLAVVNPRLGNNADPAVANVLGEILGIEITRTGKYAVYPRNTTLEAVQTEWDNQRQGAAATADPQGPGNGDRPDHVLSVIARGGEGSVTATRFNASIINMDTREQISFTSQTYQNIEAGTMAMQAIAKELTITDAKRLEDEKKHIEDEKVAAAQWAQGQRERERKERQAKRAAWWRERKEYAFRSSFDCLGFSFLWGDEVSGFSLDMLGLHWSFLPFTSIGLQGELGALGEGDLIDNGHLTGGIIFNAGLVFPLTTNAWGMNVSLYGDGLLEINLAEPVQKGLLMERVTSGFDCGISFLWGEIDDMRWGFDIKYRGLWYKDQYLNAIGIGLTWGFDWISWND
ncbi:MAG: hypothetical protein LBK83_11135 [Treponema sp.]|jgi:hypothetical protein|nr:hypothetical protein [Treponema sp.]